MHFLLLFFLSWRLCGQLVASSDRSVASVLMTGFVAVIAFGRREAEWNILAITGVQSTPLTPQVQNDKNDDHVTQNESNDDGSGQDNICNETN